MKKVRREIAEVETPAASHVSKIARDTLDLGRLDQGGPSGRSDESVLRATCCCLIFWLLLKGRPPSA